MNKIIEEIFLNLIYVNGIMGITMIGFKIIYKFIEKNLYVGEKKND